MHVAALAAPVAPAARQVPTGPAGPRIDAPVAARDPRMKLPASANFDSDPIGAGPLASVPRPVAEPLFKFFSKINRHVFKSDPPGAPVAKQPGSWEFGVIGDYGSAFQAQADVAKNIIKSDPEFLLTTGDNVYSHGTEKEWQQKFDPPHLMGDVRKKMPVYPTLGNHDTSINSDPYFKRFPELDGARYYSFENKGVHFSAVNTTESVAPGSAQAKWLDQDLTKAAGSDFKVVYFHHPIATVFNRGQKERLNDLLGPVMAKHGVDLLLAGHEHNYERTKPLDDRGNGKGAVHAVVGGGGNTLYPFTFPQPSWSAYRDVDYGHLNVEVQNDALVGRYMVRDGSIRDTFTVPKRKQSIATAASGASVQEGTAPVVAAASGARAASNAAMSAGGSAAASRTRETDTDREREEVGR